MIVLKRISPIRQRGITLTELMVAMTLGLIITAVILGVYVTSSRNYSQDERFALLQENGRYALRVLTEDLAMADFWGQIISTDTITSSVSAPAGGCEGAVDLYNPDTGLIFNNYHADPPDTQFTPCDAVTGNRYGNSDVLVIKRVEGAPTAGNLKLGHVYLRTAGSIANFIVSTPSTSPPSPGERDWQYMPRIYFVRDHFETAGDGIPALCRLELSNDAFGATQCIAEGVEDLHLEYGLDSDGDGVANRYNASPVESDMKDVVSVRVHLLMRANKADAHYSNTKTYRLGAIERTVDDGFYRRVYSSTVVVRNVVGRRQFL